MDAIEFIRERDRMCRSFGGGCEGCSMDGEPCGGYMGVDAERLIGAVEAWSKENPRKTRQSEFLKQYPYANRIDGVMAICPKAIDINFSCLINDFDCSGCRREFWMQEVK